MRALAVLASMASSILLARMLGPEEYGVYAFIFALVAILALPVQMGLPTLITRETATAAATGDWPLLRGIWLWSTRIICAASAAIVVLVTLALIAEPQLLAEGRAEAMLWGIWLVPLMALAAAREAALRGLKAAFLSGLPDQVLRPTILAALVLAAALLFQQRITAVVAMQLGLVAAAVGFLAGVAMLVRVRPRELAGTKEATINPAEWLKAFAPFSLIAGLQLIRENTDIIMLGLWYNDADVGLYRIALSIGTLGVFGLVALYLVAQPYIVSAFTTGDHQRLQTIARGVATLSFAASLAVTAVIWLAGDRIIILLYGDAYQDAYLPLAILTAGSVIHAFFGMAGGVLALTGHEKSFLWVSAFAVLLNVAGNAVLIPPYGATGAAVATAASLAMGEAVKFAIAKRKLGLDASPLAWLHSLRTDTQGR